MAFDGDKLLGGSGRRHRFMLVGGHPALDFINGHDWFVSAPHDYLSEFADAIRFAVKRWVSRPGPTSASPTAPTPMN
jgi:hypothetical protein